MCEAEGWRFIVPKSRDLLKALTHPAAESQRSEVKYRPAGLELLKNTQGNFFTVLVKKAPAEVWLKKKEEKKSTVFLKATLLPNTHLGNIVSKCTNRFKTLLGT